jgi:hypothetical protein
VSTVVLMNKVFSYRDLKRIPLRKNISQQDTSTHRTVPYRTVPHTERKQPPNGQTLVTATFCWNTNTIKIKEMAGTELTMKITVLFLWLREVF